MEAKQKALVTGLVAVGALAAAMFLYYQVVDRTRKTESQLESSVPAQKADAKSEFAGTYGASEPIEGNGMRFASFTVSLRNDGTFGGAVKLDAIGSETGSVNFLHCPEVKVGEKDLFLKCLEPALGVFSFSGEAQPATDGAVHMAGHLIWSKDGSVFMDKSTTLTRLSAE